jgi:DNA polymerase
MKQLNLDIETYSSVDLGKCGVYKYAASRDFEILLIAYSIDGGPVQITDLTGDNDIPDEVFDALSDSTVEKHAHNANFERTCLSSYFNLDLPATQWHCSMVRCAMMGLPLSLATVGEVLNLEQLKLTTGKQLIKYFCMPCLPTIVNKGRTRNLPKQNPVKWEEFIKYCMQDVVVEQAVSKRLEWFQIPPQERRLWILDQKINDAGIMADPVLIRKAIDMDYTYRQRLNAEAIDLTKLKNPNSVIQLKEWVNKEAASVMETLTKDSVTTMLEGSHPPKVKRMLQIRQEMARSSVRKYESMARCMGGDRRIRGLLQFCGAARTGRWGGRLCQPQNYPKIHLPDLELAHCLASEGNLEMIELLYASVADTLSQLLRTSFIASPGNRLIVSDSSAIEARVIAWLANEKWRLDVFATHGKIYEASAAEMFRVPIESVTEGSELRYKGKISELALGFGGSTNALIKMGALKMGLTEEELFPLVQRWRGTNGKIVDLWHTVGKAAMEAVADRKTVRIQKGITFSMERGVFFVTLPSKRRLSYIKPKIGMNRFGNSSITYEGMNQTTNHWCKQDTYGGKLVENIVQAIARDCLADAMTRIDAAGYPIVLTVHDEIVCDVPKGFGSIKDVINIMSAEIPWAKGLILGAKGMECNYYQK